ncbi:MAG: HAMP domain-containing sensor histidine kinase, partial [Prolixibacteraceae bacterium]|nr:HAMP domain-containing sensor histidine kinase [Prolixibacteraceae bacterium]
IIHENAISLTHLINHVFDFSLLKSYKVDKVVSLFSVSKLLDEVTDLNEIQKKTGDKNLNLIKDYDPLNVDIEISTDREKLFQVINHVILNAFKFTLKGEITIGYRLKEKSMMHFQIKDTGIGIDKNKIEFIFDPFRQADERRTNTNRGIGLGLSISKSIIELLGGKIWIESEPSKGTTCNFTIPTDL